ncbi:MAG: HAD-IA family hydrolase [Planctomycetota bacterium]
MTTRSAAKALLVDFGGTLATERSSRAAIYAEAARARGVEVEDARMARLMAAAHDRLPREHDGEFRYGRGWFERFMRIIFTDELRLSSATLQGIAGELFARFADARTFRVFPDARDLLGRARARGLPIAVVSNWSEALDGLVRDLGLDVDVVLSSAVLRSEKPEPAIFLAALRAVGADPADALHVGDSLRCDVEGARAVGVRAVLLDRSATGRAGSAAKGVPRVRSLEDLEL